MDYKRGNDQNMAKGDCHIPNGHHGMHVMRVGQVVHVDSLPTMGEKEDSKEVVDLLGDSNKEKESISSIALTPTTVSEERATWDRQIEFLLSCVGYSVGMGNIWRFPYLCAQNGGGSFVLAYLVFLCLCGTPLFYMESVLGQSTGLSTVRVFEMIPIFQGLGWCMAAASGVLSVYYNVILAWIIYYFGMSFQWSVPWGSCDNSWNTPNCTYHYNQSTSQASPEHQTTPAQEFWLYNVLDISDNISIVGQLNWKLSLCHVAGWLLLFICICRGIRSTGKVVYVTATAPFVFLTIMLIRAATLPGAWMGVKLYVTPDWNHLGSIAVWVRAATQIFYSLGPAWGGLITFASYNRFSKKIIRDAMIAPIVCGFTSIFGGFVIFSAAGHMMWLTNQTSLETIVDQGPGLAFIAYPQVLSTLPGAAIWSVLFFLTLLTIGLDSQFAFVETLLTGLIDRFPQAFGRHKVIFTFCVCTLEAILGIIFVSKGGFYFFELMDYYSTTLSIVVIGFFECLAIGYVYGAGRLLDDVELMNGKMRKSSRRWWMLCWLVITPLFTLTVVVSTIYNFVEYFDMEVSKFTISGLAVGWIAASLSFIQLPIGMVLAVYEHFNKGTKLFAPRDEWRLIVQQRMDADQDSKLDYYEEA